MTQTHSNLVLFKEGEKLRTSDVQKEWFNSQTNSNSKDFYST